MNHRWAIEIEISSLCMAMEIVAPTITTCCKSVVSGAYLCVSGALLEYSNGCLVDTF